MHKKIGCGFFVACLLLAGGLLLAFSQSDEGKWLIGLILLYGGVTIVGAAAYDTIPGHVVDFNRLDPPTHYSAGSIRFSYQDDDGTEREQFRRVMHSTDKFRKLQVGDSIKVWVCRKDRTKVKLVGYGTHEPGTCGEKRSGNE